MLGKVFAALALGAAGYFGYSHWKDSVEADKQAGLAAARATRVKEKVLSLANAHGAIVDWASRLSRGQRIRLGSVLTAELQDLWAGGTPILFVGNLSDIIRAEGGVDEMVVDYGVLDQRHVFMGTELRIKVRCPRFKVNPFVASASDPRRSVGFSDIAIVTSLESIETASRRDSDGGLTEVFTGTGTCLEVVRISEPVRW